MIALLFALLVQDVADLDPIRREAAHKKILESSRGRESELKKGQSWIELGFLGHKSAQNPLLKMIKEGKPEAAEAYAYLRSKSGLRQLLEALNSEEDRMAFSAARALASLSDRRVDRELTRRAAKSPVAAYASVLRGGPHLNLILSSAENLDRRGLIATLNLETALDTIRRVFGDTPSSQVRNPKMKEKLETGQMTPEQRSLFGLVLLRAGVVSWTEMLDYLKSDNKDLAAWAAGLVKSPIGYRCVLIENLLQKMEAGEELEIEKQFVAVTKYQAEEETFIDRVKAYRKWWDERRNGVTDADVPTAIDTGVAFLKSRQRKDGSWKYCDCGFKAYSQVDHTEGTTALTVYTLLKCDVPIDDAAVWKGLEFLVGLDVPEKGHSKVYTASCLAIALSEAVGILKARKDRKSRAFLPGALKKIQACANFLMEAQVTWKKGGYEQGAWTYNKPIGGSVRIDNSNTQFAILGLLAAQNVGVKIPKLVWQRCLYYWMDDQLEDGGWVYVRSSQPDVKQAGSNSMTAAGLCCYLIAKASVKKIETEKAAAKDKVIDGGTGKFTKRYPVARPARNRGIGHVFSVYYDLYSLERAMMLGGMKKLGGRDWYHDGALYILYNQLGDGSWLDITDTCFALLFLKKAYIPVATGK